MTCRKYKKNHLQLAFGCEGGGSGRSLGLTGVSSGPRKNEWEKRATTNVVACFCDALFGPTSWVPPRIPPPPTPLLVDAHIPLKRGGVDAAAFADGVAS